MKQEITDSQRAFFTKNGYIEFEIPHTCPPLSPKRDQFREDAPLKSFITKTLGPICTILTGKKPLQLGLTEWITKENLPKKAGLLKDLISIQKGVIVACLSPHPILPEKRSPLGLLPSPSTSDMVLFFKPQLILDWPRVHSDLFLILFTLSNGVYIHNPLDPKTTYLKELGYAYGDLLNNETHPLIFH